MEKQAKTAEVTITKDLVVSNSIAIARKPTSKNVRQYAGFSIAFTYAHLQIRQIWSNQQQLDQVTQEWQAAMRIGPSNQTYPDAKGWKFAMLQVDWKAEHPFETWYEQYLAEISQKAAEKTASEDTSDYMLRHQAEILEAQAAELRAKLKARHS